MRNRILVLLPPLLFIGLSSAEVATVDEKAVLQTLKPDHPRLMLSAEDLNQLKQRYESDAVVRGYADQVKEDADRALTKAPLEHKLIGPRLLSVSRECLDRVYCLALVYRWTGDEKYAKAAEANLLTVSAFPDWNPPHFLDTAEMSHAVGVGYDWLFGWLSDTSKKTIREALIEKGLKPGIEIYKKGGWWTVSEFNWNQVCNGGMITGALAVAETDPEYAQFILPRAMASLPKALHAYDPDGAWMEGPGYWHYATRYAAYGLCALQTALGTDFGLTDMPGLRATGLFPWYTTGPTGLFLNYADSGERSAHRPMPCMFWLARQYNNRTISDLENKLTQKNRASAEHLVWYIPPTDETLKPLELDRWFHSPVDIVVMRSAWDDPNALFIGAKGGYNQVNHGHLDLGNFEMDALGVRWARDLGSDNYNLPGYFDKKPGGRRWQYYRMRSESHSVPLINGRGQRESGTARVTRLDSGAAGAVATIDLSGAYESPAQSVIRDIALINNRRAVVIRDRVVTSSTADVVWGMVTDANITVEDKTSAVLELQGRKLRAKLIDANGTEFSVESCEQVAPQKENKGVKRLLATKRNAGGKTTICVVLAPVWPEGPVENPDLAAVGLAN